MLEDFFFPLIAVGLAELGDKTQLSVLLLSTKTDKRLQLLLGVMLAFLVVDGAAILAGTWIADNVPAETVKAVAGIAFIGFGLLMLKSKPEKAEDRRITGNPLVAGFALIALMEMGDKTQLASAGFATQYEPVYVLAGVMAALTVLSVAAVYLGKRLAERIDPEKTTKVAGVIFILLGLGFFLF